MLESYLEELRREFKRSLPAEDIQIRLAEAEAHLRDGVEGRIELGLDPEAAEREAIAAFGLSRQVGRAMIPVKANPKGRKRLLLLGYGLGLLFLLVGCRFMEAYPRMIEGFFAAWIGIGAVFAFVSFRAKRPSPLPVLATGLAGAVMLWVAAGTTWTDLTPYGGLGLIAPGTLEDSLRKDRVALVQSREDRDALRAGMALLNGPGGIEALRTADGYRAPVYKRNWSTEDRLSFTTMKDPQAASRAWVQTQTMTPWSSRVMELERNTRAIAEASNISTATSLANFAPIILLPNVGVAFLAVVVDLLFGGLGALAAFYFRRPSGGVHA